MSQPITLAQLGWIHEFGTSRSGKGRRTVIPARPFLVPALQENREELRARLGVLLRRVIAGKMSKREALGDIGAKAQRMVQEKIRNGPFLELAESTKKRRRGPGPYTPLWDIGNMAQNVEWDYDS